MARLVGTGKDPRYPKGIVYDIADDFTGQYQEHIDRGWGKPAESDPGVDAFQVANAMVRGDNLFLPEEKELAAEIGKRAHAIVHTGDVTAKVGDDTKDTESVSALSQAEAHHATTHEAILERNAASAEATPPAKPKSE